MKECEKCKYLRRCSNKLVCGSSSSSNCDQYIEKIDWCDVFGFNLPFTSSEDIKSDETVIPFENNDEEDIINHPKHYNSHQYECIDEMLAVFGKEAVIHFCICNVWKYRHRADDKGSHEENMAKADWYINKLMELKNEKNYDWIEERR